MTLDFTDFLSDLNQSNICRDIQKIESLIRQSVSIPQKNIQNNKKDIINILLFIILIFLRSLALHWLNMDFVE